MEADKTVHVIPGIRVIRRYTYAGLDFAIDSLRIHKIEVTAVLFGAEALIAALKDSGDYDDVMCNRLRTVLTAPHKHKDREAHKTKQQGRSLGIHFSPACHKTDP